MGAATLCTATRDGDLKARGEASVRARAQWPGWDLPSARAFLRNGCDWAHGNNESVAVWPRLDWRRRARENAFATRTTTQDGGKP